MTRCRWFLRSRKHQPFLLYFLCISFHYCFYVCLSDAMVSFRRPCAQMLALEFTVKIGLGVYQPLRLKSCRKENLPLPAKLYWYKLRLVSLCNLKHPSTCCPAEKHPKHDKSAVTNKWEKPVDFLMVPHVRQLWLLQ